jgi:hypothetical protein
MRPPTYRVQHKKVEESESPWKDIGKNYTDATQARDCKDWLETTVKAYVYRIVEVTEVYKEIA